VNREFKPGQNTKTIIGFAILFLWISLPLAAYIFLASVISLITLQDVLLSRAFVAIFVSGYGFYIVLRLTLQQINEYNQIRVIKDGLYVRVYVFRYSWKFVEWSDVLGIQLSFALDRWHKPLWLINVRKLTYWHKLLSAQYGSGTQPCIVVSSDIIDRDELLDLIERKLKKKSR